MWIIADISKINQYFIVYEMIFNFSSTDKNHVLLERDGFSIELFKFRVNCIYLMLYSL